MVRELKAAGPLDVVQEMVRTTGDAEADIITDLVNKTIVEGVIPAE